jgi:hypothetical protein
VDNERSLKVCTVGDALYNHARTGVHHPIFCRAGIARRGPERIRILSDKCRCVCQVFMTSLSKRYAKSGLI